MLTNVHVKNLALIEEAEVELNSGFNILTGETGAGKSIIIGSINYCLGAKADKEVIREGTEYALVELTFQENSQIIKNVMADMELPLEDDGSLILTRKIMPQRSTFKVNGESVTAKQMKELATYLIDIHGQHEHQSLLSEKKQKNILDGFAGDKLGAVKDKMGDCYRRFRKLEEEIASFSMDEAKREREISLAQFEVDEIENAALVEGEEEELQKKHNKLQNGKRIAQALSAAIEYLDGDEGGALSAIGYAGREVSGVSGLDDELVAIAGHLTDSEQVLMDAVREIRDYVEELDFAGEEYVAIEERLDLINRLSIKYGQTTKDIIAYGEERRQELEKLIDSENYVNNLVKQRDEVFDSYKKLALEAHKLRADEANRLSKDITEALMALNFLKVSFAIDVNESEDYTSDGFDNVSFNISLNPGEKSRALKDVASGGEMSRIMLAMKTVLADRDNIGTFIFDEIDTGISGVTAWQVSKKIGKLSKNNQIICITHLPQIAAMADSHFMIAKNEKWGKTVTEINILDEEQRIREVARLLGGEHLSGAAYDNAKELIEEARKCK